MKMRESLIDSAAPAAPVAPIISDWRNLDAGARRALLARPAVPENTDLEQRVARILAQVGRGGDGALRDLTRQHDGCDLQALEVEARDLDAADTQLPAELKEAIRASALRIAAFHNAAAGRAVRVETAAGVVCERVARPVRRVGLYVPAGSSPLPSTALMLGIPARLAGCSEVVLCSPPDSNGQIHAAILYAARLCGIRRVFRLGGAQAIAAMAFGTESVPACDKIFGPGNAWVTEAKRQVSQRPGGPAIDMPAGPSELLVIADGSADALFVAADLLSQAEHGPDSQVLLISDCSQLLDEVAQQLSARVRALPRHGIASAALAHSRLIRVESIAQAVEISNRYAPEHLILNVREPRRLLPQVENAGSVFLGPWSPESAGDYASGTNHVLPTGGAARVLGGLSVDSFCKYITVQELSTEGIRGLAGNICALARAEGLEAHAQAVEVRLEALEGGS